MGTLTETLTVTAQAPIIQSDSATVGALLPETAVQDLPLNGRNVIGLVRGLPGANEGLPNSLSSGNRPDDRRQTSTVSVNGQNDVLNNNLIDGMDNNERFIGTIGVRPSVDAIAEVKVQTNMYTAETGRTAGAVVNILTKSGTNDYHGSGYGFFRNEKYDAYEYFARRDQPKPRLRQQQWGGSFGGRIIRNKTFFFADYERYHQERGVTFVSTVPTPAMKNGDFSELLGRGIAIYDPLTNPRTPFPNNVIPANRIDPVAQRFLNLYPTPSAPGLGSNFTTTVNREQTSDTFDVRLDHRFTDTRQIYVRYSDNGVETLVPGVFGIVNGIDPGGSAAGFGGPSIADAWGLHANYLEIIRPTLLFEVKAGKLYFNTDSLPETFGQNVATEYGLQGINIDARTSGLPNFAVAGYTTLGDPRFVPILLKNDTWQAQASLTNVRGAHNLKAGVAVVRRTMSPIQSNDGTGLYTFTAAPTNNGAGGGGDAAAAFLLGYPFTVARAHLVVDTALNTWEPSLFLQDDWRATDWLTLNLGAALRHLHAVHRGRRRDLQPRHQHAAVPHPGRERRQRHRRGGDRLRQHRAAVRLCGHGPRGHRGAGRLRPELLPVVDGLQRGAAQHAVHLHLRGDQRGGVGRRARTCSSPRRCRRRRQGTPAVAGTIAAVDTDLKSSYLHQYNVMVEQQLWGGSVTAGYVGSKGRPDVDGDPEPQLRAGRSRRHQPAALLRGGRPEPDHARHAAQRRPAGLQRDAAGVHAPLAGRADLRGQLHAGQGHERRHPAGRRRRAAGLRRRSDPDPRARVEPERHRHPPPLRLLAQLRAAVRPRRHRRAPLPHRRLAGQPPGLLAERRALHRVQHHRAQQHRRRPWTAPTRPARASSTTRPSTGGSTRRASSARSINTIGNSGRNNLYGPPQRRADMSLFKDIVFGTQRLQLRLEVFNVTNTRELRRARRRARLGDLRPDHLDRQQHPAAVPVRGEVPVLSGAPGARGSGLGS